MGLLTGLLLLPLAPLRGTVWLAERLAEYAEAQLDEEQSIRRLLLEAEAALEAGELSETQYDEVEDELLERLEQIRSSSAVEGIA
jgi:Gas vesicle protein G